MEGIYYEQKTCIMCGGVELTAFFEENYKTPLSFSFSHDKEEGEYMPFNVVSCGNCKTVQNKYFGNLALIYKKNHVDTFGSLKKEMCELFSDFVVKNTDIDGIIEVGACTDTLAQCMLDRREIPYTVIEPDFNGDRTKIKVIPSFFDEADLSDIPGNALVMSNLFEHLYDPVGVIQKLYASNIKYIYLNNPDLETNAKENTYIILNTEHIYYIENEFLYSLFEKYGYKLKEKVPYKKHTIFMKFERQDTQNLELPLMNKTAIEDCKMYFYNMNEKISKINKILESGKKVYMWPAATYNIVLFVNGLRSDLLAGLADNSPNKIGKYIYGYNVECFDFKKLLESDEPNSILILGGSVDYRNELKLESKKMTVLFLNEL
jgi:hypothetical protein